MLEPNWLRTKQISVYLLVYSLIYSFIHLFIDLFVHLFRNYWCKYGNKHFPLHNFHTAAYKIPGNVHCTAYPQGQRTDILHKSQACAEPAPTVHGALKCKVQNSAATIMNQQSHKQYHEQQ